MEISRVRNLVFTTDQVADLLGVNRGSWRQRLKLEKPPFVPKTFHRAKAREWMWATILDAERYLCKKPIVSKRKNKK